MFMKTGKRNHAVILTIVAMVLALTGCAQKPAPVEESKSSTESNPVAVVEAVKPTEEVEVSSEVAPEPTVESTPEPTTEAVVYEGIDMESTLPGAEWIATFEGVIDEPKIVVYNDATNKKVIVENGGEVDFAEDDTLAIRSADATTVIVVNEQLVFKKAEYGKIATFSGIAGKYKKEDSLELECVFELNGEQITYKVTLNLQ